MIYGRDIAGGTVFASQGVIAPTDTGGGGVTAVPEPSTWAMMIVGCGLVGSTMRRRKTAVATRVRFA